MVTINYAIAAGKKQQPGLASNSWPQGGHDSRWSKKIAERYVLLFNMLVVLQKICTKTSIMNQYSIVNKVVC